MPKLLRFLLALILAGCAMLGFLFLMSSHTKLAFDPPPKAIGIATPIGVRIDNPHGVRHLEGRIEQNGATATMFIQERKPWNRFNFVRLHRPPEALYFMAGKDQAPNLKEGKARVIFETQSNDLRASVDSISTEVEVVLKPPSVTGDDFEHNINQGGSEMAMFTPSGYWTVAGVRVGDHEFRSFAVPGNPNQRFALFAFAWDLPHDTAPTIFVRNVAATEATAPIRFKLFPKKFATRDLAIDDAFLEKVVKQIDPNGSGDLLTRFLKINGEIRRENNQFLADLRLRTDAKFLWTEPFLQLPNSKVESGFANIRNYIYKGKKVDQQVHLGFDLAVGEHTPVPAANDGTVVWAASLGIYGNCIVVDHGFGLQSIYGHLSELAVKVGDPVKRGQPMGKTGSTGLAGGDHLHFSMQVDGVQVNPIEWWDGHWIKDHIQSRFVGRVP